MDSNDIVVISSLVRDRGTQKDLASWLSICKRIDEVGALKSSHNPGSPKLADTLSGALALCHDGNFDLGYQLINEVIGQLRAGA
jgi:hypothetical protein